MYKNDWHKITYNGWYAHKTKPNQVPLTVFTLYARVHILLNYLIVKKGICSKSVIDIIQFSSKYFPFLLTFKRHLNNGDEYHTMKFSSSNSDNIFVGNYTSVYIHGCIRVYVFFHSYSWYHEQKSIPLILLWLHQMKKKTNPKTLAAISNAISKISFAFAVCRKKKQLYFCF